MKKIFIVALSLMLFAFSVSAGQRDPNGPGEVIIIDSIGGDNNPISLEGSMRSYQGQSLVEYYYDGYTPVVYVNIIPTSSNMIVCVVNHDTMEVFYDIAPAGSAEMDIAISGSAGRYEVIYYATGVVPVNYAQAGSLGYFMAY